MRQTFTPLFNGDWYAARLDLSGRPSAFERYVTHGWRSGEPYAPEYGQAPIGPGVAYAAGLGGHPLAAALVERERSGGMFDGVWYLSENADVATAGVDPFEHFVLYGCFEGRSPSPQYSLSDMAAAGGRRYPGVDNPFAAALLDREGAACWLDATWYLNTNPDLVAAGVDPMLHYYNSGWLERRKPSPQFGYGPSPSFDADWYRQTNADVLFEPMLPYDHFLSVGWKEGRDPSPDFSLAAYAHGKPVPRHGQWNPFVIALLEQAEGLSLFDRDWYLATYPDVRKAGFDPFEHYLEHGWREGRRPNPVFDATRFSAGELGQKGRDPNPFVRYLIQAGGASPHYFLRQAELAASHSGAETMTIFFNVARDIIGGGMLSCDRLVAESLDILRDDPSHHVVVSGVPLGQAAVTWSRFKASAPQVEFGFLVSVADPAQVRLMLPECFVVDFVHNLSEAERSWLLARAQLEIVVMNQNDELMPEPEELRSALSSLTEAVIISTAHARYNTALNAALYLYPHKQLTPILPTMRRLSLQDKEKLILVSPDQIVDPSTRLKRDEIVAHLQSSLPDFNFVTIFDTNLEDYLDLASRAMFSVTFGEGMDGYFIEPILAGGNSFAVYNDVFFPKSFLNVEGVFGSWDDLRNDVPRMVRTLSESPDLYAAQSDVAAHLVGEIYTRARSRQDLSALLRGEVDHPVVSRRLVQSEAEDCKCILESEGYRFFRFDDGLNAVLTPRGAMLRFRSDGYLDVLSAMDEVGELSALIESDASKVVIDIGAARGIFSVELATRHASIERIYAYDPSFVTGKTLRKNLEFNGLGDKVSFQQIGLSDRDQVVVHDIKGSSALSEVGEFEFVSSAAEIGSIRERHPGVDLILRLGKGAAVHEVMEDLDRSGELNALSALMIRLPARGSAPILARLSKRGFSIRHLVDRSGGGQDSVLATRQSSAAVRRARKVSGKDA